jgi:hypothetical protein
MARHLPEWKAKVDAIRRILISDWDPIRCGVPEDEYDSYIPVIYRLMQAGGSAKELAAHLQKLETEAMCLPARPEANLRVANMLLDLMEKS